MQCDHGKGPGETVEIGDMVGHGLEPNLITGRVCGFIKTQPVQVLYRKYRSQTEKWPSGDLVSRRISVCWPHMHLDGVSCSRFIAKDVANAVRIDAAGSAAAARHNAHDDHPQTVGEQR